MSNKVVQLGKLVKSSGDSRWFFSSETECYTFFMSLGLYRILSDLGQKGWEPTFKDDEGFIYFVRR